MIPHPWPALVLALAAFRLARLVGWDDLPPIHRARAWVTGAEVVSSGSTNARMGLTSESVEVSVRHRRPLLAHFLGCPFCQGFWVSLAVYGAWLAWPRPALYAAAPFALSALVGLVAKNLDP